MGKGAKKISLEIIYAAIKALAVACWYALQGAYAVLMKTFVWIKGVFSVISDFWNTVQGWITPIWDFYKDNIKPALDTFHGVMEITRTAILAVQGRLDELWNKVLNDILGPLKEVMDDVKRIWTGIADVVSIFNAQLAEQMLAVESSITAKYNAAIDAVYEKTIGEVKGWLDIPLRKLNELEALYNLYVKTYINKLDGALKIIETTFEKPNVLGRSVLWSTSQHWGMDLWNDLFSGVLPEPGVKPPEPGPVFGLTELIESRLQEMLKEEKGEWSDAYASIGEEIYEAVTGKTLAKRTEVKVTELPKEIDWDHLTYKDLERLA